MVDAIIDNYCKHFLRSEEFETTIQSKELYNFDLTVLFIL
jgi:hypothetical protein